MKKILLAVAVLAIFAVQQVNAQKFNFGAKGGVNFANFNGKDADGTKVLTSFHLGVVAEYMINDQFAVQPEVLFSAQGAKIEEEQKVKETWKSKFNYINVPVMVKYYVANGFNIQAGPQFGFLTSAKSDGENIKDDIKTFDFGLNLGLGYKLDNNIFFDARYNLGLTNLPKEGDEKARNGVFQLSVGYMF